jgi:hypothetical protein
VDTERYGNSVETFDNWFSTPQGTAMRRPGSEFFFQTLNNGPARLEQFSRGRENDYVVEFTDGNIRMFDRDGVVQAAGGEELTNPQFNQGADGLLGWTLASFLTQQQDVNGELIDVDVMEIDVISPSFKVTQLAGAVGGGTPPPPNNFVDLSQSMTVDEDPLNPGTWLPHTITTDILFAGDGNLFTIRVMVGDGVSETAYIDQTYNDGTGNGTFPLNFTPLTATVTLKYEFRLTGVPTTDPNFATIENISLKPQINDPLILTSPFTADMLASLDTSMDLGSGGADDVLWICHPDVAPQLLTRISRNDWTIAPAVFTGAPAFWTAGNYPAQVEVASSRVTFSGSPANRTRIIGSKAGDYFELTAGANPGDAFDLDLVTRGGIQWIRIVKRFLLGTDLALHTINAVQGEQLAVGNISVTEQGQNSSAPVEPIVVGSEVVYISADRTKLYSAEYLRDVDGYPSRDLTWFAEHLTMDRIIRHVWARDPNREIFCIMESGNITNCVYDQQYDLLSWSRYTTNGQYIDACVTDNLRGSDRWYCVKRGDNYYIETVQAGEVNNQYSDSWLSKPTVDKVVDGLEHLEGETVKVLVDGAVEPDKVVTGGQITTSADGNAVVGLAYNATLKTLRTEGGNQAGTSQVSLMDFSEVFLRLNNSAVPVVNGRKPPLRDPQTPMNTPEPLTTGDSVTWHVGRSGKGQLTIEQDLPLRTEILAIYGKLRSNTI